MTVKIQPVPAQTIYGEIVKRFLDILRRQVSRLLSINAVSRVTSTPFTSTDPVGIIFANTDSASVVVNLEAGDVNSNHRIVNTGSSGNILTVTPNGTEHLLGVNSSFILNDGEALIISYDSTDGWY